MIASTIGLFSFFSNLLSGVEFTLDVPGNNLQDEVDDTIQFDNFLDEVLSEDETRQYGMFEEIREKMVDLTDDGKLKKYVSVRYIIRGLKLKIGIWRRILFLISLNKKFDGLKEILYCNIDEEVYHKL